MTHGTNAALASRWGRVVFSSMPLSSVWAPAGPGFTTATLIQMQRLARQSLTNPQLVWLARRIAAGTGDGHNQVGVAQLIREWLGMHIVFVADPTNQEMLSSPSDSLAQIIQYGNVGMDCDEIATLGAALALAVGLRATFRVVQLNGRPEYAHVFTVVPTPQGMVSLDIQSKPPAVTITGSADFPV